MNTFMELYQMQKYRRVPWVVFGDEDLVGNLHDQYLALDNKIVFALDDADRFGFRLLEAYAPGPSLPLRVQSVGSWSPLGGLEHPHQREPFGRRTDLTGLHLRVTTVPFPPFVITEENGDGTLSISGNHAELFNILQTSLNFTATFYSPPDGGWGAIDPATGLMNGMIGQLQRKLADVALNALDITITRSMVVDYPVPLDSFGYWLVMERPGRGADWRSYTAEFTADSWLMIVGAAVLLALLLHLISRVSPYEPCCALADAGLYVIGACCNMGFHHQFQSTSTRVLVVTLFMMTILVYTNYTSFLTATLAVIKIKMPFEDLQGLYASRDDYHLGMLGDSSLTDLLRSSEQPFLRDLWLHMLEPNPEDMVPTNDAGMQRIREDKYVFLTYAPTYEPSSDLIKLSEQYFQVPMSWPVQKHSPLLPIFNHQFRHWLESGQYSRLWLQGKLRPLPETPGTRALGYEEMFTAFALLGVGMVLAALATCVEVVVSRRARGSLHPGPENVFGGDVAADYK